MEINNEVQSMTQAKANPVVGARFLAVNTTSGPNHGLQVIGTILGTRSGTKVEAELGCAVDGCTETHVRQISDWHQCSKCRTHSKVKAKGSGASVRTELDTDPEIAALQAQLREMQGAVKAQKKVESDAERLARAKTAKLKALGEKLAKLKAMSAVTGLPISQKTLSDMEAEASAA